MNLNSLKGRPLVAALLATLVAGLGHLYLKKWARTVAWFTLIYVAGLVFVPRPELIALVNQGAEPPVAHLLPVLAIQFLSALDAYRVARTERRRLAALDPCPNCGKPTDDDLEFCPWCTQRLGVESPEQDGASGNRLISR